MDNSLIYTNAHPDPQINENRLSDENFINELQKVRQLLEKHFNYGMSGDLYVDLNYVYTIGYDEIKCISGGYFCANCIADFLDYKAKCNLIKTQYPFVTYRDKLNFLVKNRDFFVTYDITYVFDNISFSFLPQNEEEVDIFLEFKEKENKEMRLNGQKNIDDLPIVSFGELKCSLFQKAQRSADPKQLIQNEYKQLTALFPKNQTYGPGATFWYIYDLKVNAKNHKHGINIYLDTAYIEFGSLAEHYVNYYFYLNDIIENKQDAFLESLKYVDINLIYFRPNSTVLLSQKESDEIVYSGMYIQDICCLTPIRFIQNIFKDTKITKDEYNIIFSVFTNHGFWDFGELKFNPTNFDPNNSHIDELIHEIFSISESLLECREHFLVEFKNLVIHENRYVDYTLSIARFKKRFQEMFDKIYIESSKTELIKLNALDYMLKVVDKDDSYITNEFGRLIEDYKYNNEGSWQNVNPFFVYNHISERYTVFKDYVFAEFLKYKHTYDKKTFLLSIENRLNTTSWLKIKIEDVLEPYGVTFIDLFEKTTNKLKIVQEIKYDSNTILEIQRTKGKAEADRVYEQKFDVFYHILSYWRNKAIDFIREQLTELSIDLNQTVQNKKNNVQKDNIENELTDIGHDSSQKSNSNSPFQSEPISSTNLEDESNQTSTSFIKSKTKGFVFEREMDKILLKNLLDDHHDTLVKLGYISSCKTDFKSAFMGGQPFNKIKWKKSFPELQYYITKLKHKVKDDYIWATASLIFLKNDGSEFTNRQLSKTKKGKGVIKQDIEIDEIFADFYSTLDT